MRSRRRTTLIELAAAAGLGLLLAITGPYGTFSVSFPERLIYWIGLLLAAYVLFWPACLRADALARRRGLPRLPVWAATVAGLNLPMTGIVWLASFRHTPQLWPDPALYFGLYPGVLTVCAAMTVLLALLERHAQPDAPRNPDAGAADRFLDRLPPQLGRELLALEMEDHYVRVHTARGSTLVLMRMRDAVEALSGVDGERVHRSWWIARSAVADAEREGRSLRLVLTNDLRVPVPRERIADLRNLGWVPSRVPAARVAVGQRSAAPSL